MRDLALIVSFEEAQMIKEGLVLYRARHAAWPTICFDAEELTKYIASVEDRAYAERRILGRS